MCEKTHRHSRSYWDEIAYLIRHISIVCVSNTNYSLKTLNILRKPKSTVSVYKTNMYEPNTPTISARCLKWWRDRFFSFLFLVLMTNTMRSAKKFVHFALYAIRARFFQRLAATASSVPQSVPFNPRNGQLIIARNKFVRHKMKWHSSLREIEAHSRRKNKRSRDR